LEKLLDIDCKLLPADVFTRCPLWKYCRIRSGYGRQM